ncbi:DUF4097 domain-containing protein [Shewanella eurypsychrophilus]|uniref:DUF4097 domain-containing protein n=1 Tax=Shewanella eurypsychrophilus TaxID=2593656 RepID=A0ABX6VBI6_9GAMM|nr:MULTISPECIES: DUF4097 family beta strand repeat-containing protein [Shewanella]QFU24051.1 DUF4097 family beta strand repeat protein [Shewanella sp. YLB-09]QPG59260.1 DUF4097 domain-containing protein [Shewanella eurypsychrophilus]
MNKIKLSHYLLIPLLLLSHLTLAAQSIDKQIKVSGELRLNVKVLRGEIKIRSWDKQEISVQGTLDELSEGFILEQQGNSFTLEDKMPRQFSGKNKDGSSLTILVPKSLTLNAEGISSNYYLSSLEGDVSVNSVSGDIQAKDVKRYVLLHTISGDINVSELYGKVKLDTVSGSIKDKNSHGEVSYKSVSGNIDAESNATSVSIEQISGDGKVKLQQLDNLQVRSISGDIEVSFTALKSMANLESVSGDIKIKMPQIINARFNLNGGPGGKIHNQYSDDVPTKEKYSPTSYLKFQSGEPEADININTISGDIKLVKRM